MLLRWLTHLLSGLLVVSLCGLIVGSVLDQTIMNNHYLEGQLTKVNAYNRLSTGLSAEVSKQAGLSANPQVAGKVQTILTPDVLKQRINTVLDQLALYYQGKGPAPSIDLSDLAQQVQAAGVPLPADSTLTKPIQIVPDSGTNQTIVYPANSFREARIATIITSIVLAVAVFALSWQQRRYGVLPGVMITVGVLIGLGALVLGLGASALGHYVKLDTASNAFSSLGKDLAENIAHDLARRFGTIAAVLLAVGILARMFVARLSRPAASTMTRPPKSSVN